MNIQYVDHHQIDPAKWDCAVLQSPHPLVYGLFNYLNAVCDTQWDALIYNDYEAVFPLPFKKKFRNSARSLTSIPKNHRPRKLLPDITLSMMCCSIRLKCMLILNRKLIVTGSIKY